ncbi:unnamed protein product [Rhizophagus irregularis]|nr:unnamed protein product [Rhizophagus irregularis]
MNIIHYDVTITPEVPQRLNRRVFDRFVEQHQGRALGNVRPVFDGRRNMFAPKLLPFGQAGTFDVDLEEDDAAATARRRPPRTFAIKLRRVGQDIVMEELMQFLHARGTLTNNCQMAIMAMDVIIRHKPSSDHITVGRKNVYLPIEVCDVIPGQRHMRKLDERQTADMIKFTCQPPNARANKIQAGLEILDFRNNEFLREFGMRISNDMMVVNARVLPIPTIKYHPTSKEHDVRPNGGAWSLKDKKLATGATLGSWSVLAFLNQNELPDQAINPFVREFVNTCQDSGMNIPNRTPPILHANPIGNIEEALKEAWLRAAVLCERLLKGADVTHHGPGEDDKPSIAALCGSMDAKASRYAATIRVQTGRFEIIADLANMVKDLLKTFYQTCGRKPERVLFYRDGVSEGQFKHVLQSEINAVRAACQALEASYRPTITFVVVQKRHHTRFFPLDKRDSDRSGNCLPGTVVETGITHPFEFDFYLQSHAGIQGTSRPTHYHVLFDENGFNADSLQTLSYNLCHIYARCTRTVSLVPPVYYAHLVTTRAKFHTRWHESESSEGGAASAFGVVKQELQKVMYFM